MGGIRPFSEEENLSTLSYTSSKEVISTLKVPPFQQNNRGSYIYSSLGYTVLSALLEQRLKTSFESLLNQEIVHPLGLSHTHLEKQQPTSPKYFKRIKGDKQEVPAINLSNRWAGGGIISSVGDLSVLAQKFMRHQFLSEESVNQLLANHNLEKHPNKHYGFGWAMEKYQQFTFYGHTGNGIGTSGILLIEPKSKLSIIILTNLEGIDMRKLAFPLAQQRLDSFNSNHYFALN